MKKVNRTFSLYVEKRKANTTSKTTTAGNVRMYLDTEVLQHCE